MVHKINLGEDTDCSPAEGIDMAGQLQGFGVDDIDVGGRDSKDDTVGLGNVLGSVSRYRWAGRRWGPTKDL
jgi:hypothetical protein